MHNCSWLLGACILSVACQGKFGSAEEKVVPPPSPRPTYGATVSLAKAPPPISGGTLLVSKTQPFLLAADPDRDRVSIVQVDTGAVRTLDLEAGAEPGRAIEDDAGHFHVVLRGRGAVVTIDPTTGTVVGRHDVCAAPRGVTWHASSRRVFTACVGGEVMSFSPDAATVDRVAMLEPDLRDIVAREALYISRFRAADVTVLGYDGKVMSTMTQPPMIGPDGKAQSSAAVAWRMVEVADGRLMMVHQRARLPGSAPISTGAGGYSDNGSSSSGSKPTLRRCGTSIVESAFTQIGGGRFGFGSVLSEVVLPVDISAGGPDGAVAVAAAGNGHTPELGQVYILDPSGVIENQCAFSRKVNVPGQAVAVAYRGDELWVQTREPAALHRLSPVGALLSTVSLGGASVEDTGHAIFHSNAGGFIACASCHPEGGDDGRTWHFDDVGPRRTQNLRGGLLGTAPFHWDGKLTDLHALTGEVLEKRMSGSSLSTEQLNALGHFVDAIPHLPKAAPTDAAAVARGKTLFEDAKVGCATCHGGPKLTNNQTVDVGTGGPLQVPSLVGLSFRGPFMHTGCASTLDDRFAPSCGGDKHGDISALGAVQRADLVAYLKSL